MQTVRGILDNKGRDVWSIDAGASVLDAIKLMAEKGVGGLAVTTGGKLVGIITERDYARKVILKDRSSKNCKVSEIMSTDLITARENQSVEECMHLMTDNRVRHLPVTEGGELVGMISIGDLVKEIIADQQFTIKQLETYIRS